MRKFTIAAIVVLAAVLAIIAYATLVEPYALKVDEITVKLLDNGSNPITIVQASDIHGAYYNKAYFESVIRAINAQQPDIVVLTGDITNGQENDFASLGAWSQVHAKYGVYAVLGNHDYYLWGCPATQAQLDVGNHVRAGLEAANVTVLENENHILDINGEKIAVAGVGDAWVCRNDVSKALDGTEGIPRVVLAHEPNMDYLKLPGRNLVLSGHTHCGQVNLPFLTEWLLAPSFGEPFSGTRQSNETTLHTSCGVTPGLIRFNDPPDITVVKIT